MTQKQAQPNTHLNFETNSNSQISSGFLNGSGLTRFGSDPVGRPITQMGLLPQQLRVCRASMRRRRRCFSSALPRRRPPLHPLRLSSSLAAKIVDQLVAHNGHRRPSIIPKNKRSRGHGEQINPWSLSSFH